MPQLSEEALKGEICAFITSMVGQPCAPLDDLRELGLDSVGFLEVIIFIEKTLKIPLPLNLLAGQSLSTVEALTRSLIGDQAMSRNLSE